MRLQQVEHGHRLPQKLLIGVIRLMSGHRTQDIIRTLLYRPAFFGTPYGACLQEVMRGSSEWSVGERELFAAFVSRKNQCAF
jgi:hypothetical protein